MVGTQGFQEPRDFSLRKCAMALVVRDAAVRVTSKPEIGLDGAGHARCGDAGDI